MLKILIGDNFEIKTSDYEEDNSLDLPPKDLVLLHSLEKGRDVANKLSEGIEMSEQEIDDYIKTGEPMDKAGAFAIQGKGAVLIEKTDGDFYSVVGLPLFELNKLLVQAGVNVFDYK